MKNSLEWLRNKTLKIGVMLSLFVLFDIPIALSSAPPTVKIALTIDTEYDRGVIYDNPTIYGQMFNTVLDSSWITSRDLADQVSYYYEFDTTSMKQSEYWERLINFGNGNTYVLSKNSYKRITNMSDTSETRYMFAPVTLFGMPENILTHPRYNQNDRNVVYNAISWNYYGETKSNVKLAVFDTETHDFSWLNEYTSSDGPTISYTFSDDYTQLTSSYLSNFDAVIISGYYDVSLTSTQKQAIYDALAAGKPIVFMGTVGVKVGNKSAVVDQGLNAIWKGLNFPAPTVYNQYAIQYGNNLTRSIPTTGAVSGYHLGLDEGLKPILDKTSSSGTTPIPLTLFITGDAASYLKTASHPQASAAYNEIKNRINTGEATIGLHTMYHASMYLLWLDSRKNGPYLRLFPSIEQGYDSVTSAFATSPKFFRGPKLATPYSRVNSDDAVPLIEYLIDSGKTFYIDSTEYSPVSNSSWYNEEKNIRHLSPYYEPRDISYAGKVVREIPVHYFAPIGYGIEGDIYPASELQKIKRLIDSSTGQELSLVLVLHPWELNYKVTFKNTSHYFDDPKDDLLVQDNRIDKFNDFIDKLYSLKSEYASKGTTIQFITFNDLIPKGSASFSSNPSGAQIWIDSSNTGNTTPATVSNIIAGTHSYTLKLAGYNDYSGTFSVSSGQTTTVPTATLTPTDTTPPSITITSPANTTYAKPSIALNVSANEAISTWLYSLNDAANITFTPNTTITAGIGSNKIVVYAKDSANNWGSAKRYFTVDTTPPTITIASPQNITYSSTSIPLTFSAFDANGINSTWYSIDSQANVTSGNTTLTNLTLGQHNVTVYANDTAGNIGFATVYFSVSTSAYENPVPNVFMVYTYNYNPGDTIFADIILVNYNPYPVDDGIRITVKDAGGIIVYKTWKRVHIPAKDAEWIRFTDYKLPANAQKGIWMFHVEFTEDAKFAPPGFQWFKVS